MKPFFRENYGALGTLHVVVEQRTWWSNDVVEQPFSGAAWREMIRKPARPFRFFTLAPPKRMELAPRDRHDTSGKPRPRGAAVYSAPAGRNPRQPT